MIKIWKSNLKNLTSKQYQYLREICNLSKKVYNESIYNIKQHYNKEHEHLRYESNYYLMKNSPNYMRLGSNISQQSMRSADNAYKLFFSQLKKTISNNTRLNVNPPKYIPKYKLHPVVFSHAKTAKLKEGRYQVPVSRELRKDYGVDFALYIKIPNYIVNKILHQIIIVPKYCGRYFEVQFVFEEFENNCCNKIDYNKALSIDLGVNNFATCATSEGDSFIIDGRKVKSINQWYNKEMARLSSIKDKQKIKGGTKHQNRLAINRERKINDFIYCSAKYLVKYCLQKNIGNIIIGLNTGFQNSSNLGKINNQTFTMLPYGKFRARLEYLCNQVGINFVKQEESYTSKANFWGKDDIPVWNPLNPMQGYFTGKRIHRGLYKTNDGKVLNADVNGALNILRKSNVVSLDALYSRGFALTPMRIRIA